MEVQGRRKRVRPKRRHLNRARYGINGKGLSGEEVYDVHGGVRRQTSTPHKCMNTMRRLGWKIR